MCKHCKDGKVDVKCTVTVIEGCCCCKLRIVSLVLANMLLMLQVAGLVWFISISPIPKDNIKDFKVLTKVSQITFHVIGFLLWLMLLIGIIKVTSFSNVFEVKTFQL